MFRFRWKVLLPTLWLSVALLFGHWHLMPLHESIIKRVLFRERASFLDLRREGHGSCELHLRASRLLPQMR